MRFQLMLPLLAALPCGMAATTAYMPPKELLERAEQTAGCTLPSYFHIENFVGTSNGTGPTAALATFSFAFQDTDTEITTFCQFNSSSVSTTPSSLTPRFACDNRNVKFIWQDGHRELTLVERVCPSSNGVSQFEVSGSLLLSLSCAAGTCGANSTDYDGKYASISPVRDPTRRGFVKKWMA